MHPVSNRRCALGSVYIYLFLILRCLKSLCACRPTYPHVNRQDMQH